MTDTLIEPNIRERGSGWALPVAPDVAGLHTLIANLYFVGMPGSRTGWVLVDAGFGRCAGAVRRAAEERFGPGARPEAILLTHGHFDHVGAVRELADAWDVPVYAHEMEWPYLTGRSPYPPPDPTVGGGANAWLSFAFPRGPIDIGDRLRSLPEEGSLPFLPGWRVIPTPGHSPGHVSLFRESDGVLIAGDAVVTTTQESAVSAVTQTPQEVRRPPAYFTCNWIEARRSIERIAALNPSMIAAGHGIPMRGEAMREQLQNLAREFFHVGLPPRGRYVREPALTDETGILLLPPGTSAVQKLIAGLALAAAGYALWSRGRRGES